jgi:signal transduction histidine kinase
VLEVRGTGATNLVANAPLLLAMADIVAVALGDERPAPRTRRLGAPGFIRTLTHDLKSPLTAIRGHAQLLERRARRSGAIGEVTTAVTIIEQVQRMTDLLNAVADAGLAEEGSLVLQTVPLDMVALVRHAAESLDTAAGQRVVVTAPGQELPVEGDEARLRRVIATLVGNALSRARDGGCVQVSVARQGAEIVVSVQDEDAVGAPAGLPHLFDWAYQSAADPHATPDLALYSAQRMIEAHHGRLWATSSPDGSATFAFTLPGAQGRASRS